MVDNIKTVKIIDLAVEIIMAESFEIHHISTAIIFTGDVIYLLNFLENFISS